MEGIHPTIVNRIQPAKVKKSEVKKMYKETAVASRAIFYAKNWPILKVLWIAFLKGNFLKDTTSRSAMESLVSRLSLLTLWQSNAVLNFKELPWPLFVHILTYVIGRNLWNVAKPPSIVLSSS